MSYPGIWIISFLSIAAIIVRPFKSSEALWAVLGALLLIIFGFILPADGLKGILNGTSVYLFLTGMMLLAEVGREAKLFDFLAAYAIKLARSSSKRFFILIYIVGIFVTAFLSNDATAIVLTPAVAAAAKAAKIKKPLPFLLICAFVANAACFILPISNPANLIIYKSELPSLSHWLNLYIVPSLVAIAITFILLWLTQKQNLKQSIESDQVVPKLTPVGRTALFGIVSTAVILLICSALDIQLGLPTAITGIVTCAVVSISSKKNPLTILKGVSWSVLPLVAGLFVIVEALNKTGIIKILSGILQKSLSHSVAAATWASGIATAFGGNLLNNLPAGLIASNVIQAGPVPEIVKRAVLIGIDLGPNLSVTGSLATILWLVVLRREGLKITGWQFLKLGIIIMSITLFFTLASLWL
ncbi:MAG: arsenic transporter [Ginsengibacter sp.]